jgi:ribosomal protein S27E
MPLTVTCPGCKSQLRVRDEYAGKKLKCPRCAVVVAVPSGEAAPEAPTPLEVVEEHVAEALPVARALPPRDEPETAIGEGAPERRPAGPERPGGEEPRAGRRPTARRGVDYVPCPRCGSGGAKRVTWTPWGSFYGPALLTHVRCPKCGYAYNGRTGGSNTVAAVFFVLIPLLLIAVIIFGLLVALRVIRL